MTKTAPGRHANTPAPGPELGYRPGPLGRLAGPLPPKEMGVVLGVAVLLDAFLVRLVLLPVLLRLTGRAAWWSPRWLTRLLPSVRFSHA